MTLILNNEQIETLLDMPACLAAMDEAYQELGAGRAANIPRADLLAPTETEGRYHAFKTMSGTIPHMKLTALRINSDVLHWPRSEKGSHLRVKIPAGRGQRWGGLVQLFDIETGELVAIMPDGFIQKMRVGATSGVAARHMAREDASVVGLMGSGWQAGAQLEAMAQVRGLETVKVYSPTVENRCRFAASMTARLGTEVRPVASPEEAAQGAHILIAATNSLAPVIKGRWLEPGMHLTTVKSLSEVDDETVNRCDTIVVNDHHLSDVYTLPGHEAEIPEFGTGEYRNDRLIHDVINWTARPLLADVVAQRVRPREDETAVTCFLNNPGTGVQFVAAAAHVLQQAREKGIGHEIPTEWFLQSVHP
jgi:ornithine cyclodeaminase/alanine dehydrogenase-like protein (mu-crystallin family)